MTTIPADENPADAAGEEFDDLKGEIDLIGDKRQRLLRESLGVRTYEDLAALTVEEIQTAFKAEKDTVDASVIERWIAQAKELAEAKNLERRAKEKFGTDGWTTLAVFLVKFQARATEAGEREVQTAVDLMDNGEDAVWHGTTWPGIEGQRACRWMLDQLRERAPQEFAEEVSEEPIQEAPPPAPPMFEIPPTVVEIVQIRVFQPAHADVPLGTGLPNRLFPERVNRGELLTLEASFELAGLDEVELNVARARYVAQFHAYNLATREAIPLGDTEPAPLVNGQLSYTAALRNVMLRAGMYRLRVRVMLTDEVTHLGNLEALLVEVV